MTKFIAFYNLCPIQDPKEFQGIAADSEEGNIITTFGRNVVMVIKISSQKQIRSWSVLEKLSSKVVYDRRSQQYVGVFANRALRCWDENTKDVNKCKKLKFQKSIAQLICTDEDTLVLYGDGSCELLAAAIQSRKEQVDTSSTQQQQNELLAKHTLSNGLVSSLPDGRQLLTYFDRQSDTGELELVRLPLPATGTDSPGPATRFRLKRDNMNVRLAGHAVIEGDNAPMLLTIWSDKRIFLLSLHDSTNPEKSPGNFVSTLTALNVDTPLSVRGISRHLVAIYGANPGQDGGSLLLYNTQFKVIKAKQFFKVYFNESRLWATFDENILLAMGQNLSVVSYRASRELLAELVGTQSNNDFQTAVESEHINEEEPLQECLQYVTASESSTLALNETDKTVKVVPQGGATAADGNFVPFESRHDFDATLGALAKLQMQVELLEEERPLEDVQIQLMSNCAEAGFQTREVQFIARQLERCGASEHEISEKLLTVLIKARLLDEITICLRRYTNISEKMLAKTLNFVLGQLEVSTSSEKNVANPKTITKGSPQQMQVDVEEEEEALSPSDVDFPNFDILAQTTTSSSRLLDNNSAAAAVLNVLLACSFDPVAIAVHIRREIDYPKVLLLLEHLLQLLTSDSPVDVVESRPSFAAPCVEFELQLLRWFGVFLNTHFQKLALTRDVRLVELLFKWHELFAHYKREVLELEQVAALLYNIVQRKQILKGRNYSKWYNIEEVVLY